MVIYVSRTQWRVTMEAMEARTSNTTFLCLSLTNIFSSFELSTSRTQTLVGHWRIFIGLNDFKMFPTKSQKYLFHSLINSFEFFSMNAIAKSSEFHSKLIYFNGLKLSGHIVKFPIKLSSSTISVEI
jgi:hypothetical protein